MADHFIGPEDDNSNSRLLGAAPQRETVALQSTLYYYIVTNAQAIRNPLVAIHHRPYISLDDPLKPFYMIDLPLGDKHFFSVPSLSSFCQFWPVVCDACEF